MDARPTPTIRRELLHYRNTARCTTTTRTLAKTTTNPPTNAIESTAQLPRQYHTFRITNILLSNWTPNTNRPQCRIE